MDSYKIKANLSLLQSKIVSKEKKNTYLTYGIIQYNTYIQLFTMFLQKFLVFTMQRIYPFKNPTWAT